MKLLNFAFLGSLALSYSYILDDSCASYQPFITKVLQSSFDLAKAGLDVFNSPSTVKNALKAQTDLIEFMFDAVIDFPKDRQIVTDKFAAVLSYSTTSNGGPERILNPKHDQKRYLSLTSNELILFCDYDRFEEHSDYTLDTLMDYSKSRFYFLRYLSWLQNTILTRLKIHLMYVHIPIASYLLMEGPEYKYNLIANNI